MRPSRFDPKESASPVRVRGSAIALLAAVPVVAAAAAPPTPSSGPVATAPTTTAATTEAATRPAAAAAGRPATAAVGQPPFQAGGLTMTAATARVWDQGSLSVVELRGPVRIELGAAKLTADDAVVWLRPPRADGTRPVDVVLVGHAESTVDRVTVSRDRYWVPAVVTGPIRLVGRRVAGPDERSATYRAAVALLAEQRPAAARAATAPVAAASAPPSDTVPLPTAVPPAAGIPPVAVRVLQFDRTNLHEERTADGNLALVGTGGVGVNYRDAQGNLLEFTGDSMVLFTDLKRAADAGGGGDKADAASHVTSGYFEGDVRVFTTPAGGTRNELRMRAERVYYEFATDRAVMDDVVFHTVDARKSIPIFIRATSIRQLSQGEFRAENVHLSTSAFATPTFGLSAAHAYVRSEDSGDPHLGEQVDYTVDDVTLDALGLPFLYLPQTAGTMTARGAVFRGIDPTVSSNIYGPSVRTLWGLFETVAREPPPPNADADYRLDYYGKRGFAGGIDATYRADRVDEQTRLPQSLSGDLQSYFVPDDFGTDVLGAARNDERPPESFRGRVRYEHEQDLGGDLTAQVRLGYDSDSNFLQEYFNGEFQNSLPIDESFYLKRQRGSELASVGAEFQPNRVVTTADAEQADREVSHLPDLQYHREGDSLLGDRLSFFSENQASGDKFVRSEQSTQQQGFVDVVDARRPVTLYAQDHGSPGRPAYAYTGDPGSTTYVGDTRQEVDFPIHLGLVNVVPYAFGRYTAYSQGAGPLPRPAVPAGEPPVDLTVRSVPADVRTASDQNRLLGGAGVRLTTDFWRTDDSVQSDVFDLHRIRHVISPEVTLLTSGQTVDQDRVFVYDPSRDGLNDVQAAQIALRQRWQTKRGGPGHWRSVDVLTLDLYANLFANQPAVRFRDPPDFRSVFLQAEPEYGLPRNTANAEGTWRISDTTAVIGDVVHNLDRQKLATASLGIAVNRGDRINYFVGTRYIADLNSDIATVEASYQLDRKYTIAAGEQVDLAQSRNVSYQASLIRQFDNFSAAVEAHYDQASNQEGVGFSISPNGLARGLGSGQLQQQQGEQPR